ncbi:hypothetical protein ABIB57_001474 [Devosia sp. UYZn731]
MSLFAALRMPREVLFGVGQHGPLLRAAFAGNLPAAR